MKKKLKAFPVNSGIGKQCLVSRIAQQVKVLTTEPDKLNSVPGTHVVEGQKQLLRVVLCPLAPYGKHRSPQNRYNKQF